MAQIYTDECEHNIVRDCNNLFNVLKHLDVSSPKKDAESLKYLYKVTMLISYKQTSKLYPVTQFSIKYLCNHPILPITLVEIIKNSRNFKITVYSIEILFRLIVKNKLVLENDRRTIRKLFWDPQNFKDVLECIQCIYFYYKDDRTFNDILIKILKITNCLYQRKGISQITVISNFTVQFIGDLIIEYKTHKDIYQALLPIIKVLAKNKKNVNLLISEQFFSCLLLMLPTINKVATAISILKFTSKSAEAVANMSKCERLYSFILNTLSIPGYKTVYKKHLIAVLYKITKTQFGINIISKPLYWNMLVEFLSKNERQDEQIYRLILIKAYTILHRGVNKIPYNIEPLNLNIKLPTKYQNDCLEHSDESDNEIDESEEDEDIESNRNSREKSHDQIYTSEEDCDLSDDDDDIDDNYGDSDHDFDDYNDSYQTSDLLTMKRCFHEFSSADVECNTLKIYEGLRELINFRRGDNSAVRKVVENRVKRYESMNFLAFPDAIGAMDDSDEYLNPTINCFPSDDMIRKLKKSKASVDDFQRKVIYDLDALLSTPNSNRIYIPNPDTFKEEYDIENAQKLESRYKIKPQKTPTPLCFESRFESGNLRMAEQIGPNEYNLFLSPDINSRAGLQWFYFQVSGMTADVKYTFNIINFQRVNSQFNYGMQPVLFSCTNYVINGVGWRKTGENIIYYGNEYTNLDEKQYRTLSFVVSFPHSNDYCYIAYHYPYTYSRLMMRLFPFTIENKEVMYTRLDKLCSTLSGFNDVPLLTITGPTDNKKSAYVPLERRPLVFLTARVHPGESNSSWIMDGILEFLLDEQDERAFIARNNYIFKIIPMLNPDGVMFGNTRCGLTGNDLNRCWKNPDATLHPEIYYAKKLVQYARQQLKNEILTFIDIHGHSRKKFFFFYGCNPKQSWNDNDKPLDDSYDNSYLFIPRLLSTNVNMKMSFCRNTIERKRESTCRVVMWREFAIKCSYTLECSYCSGENKKKMTTKMLRDIGISIITSLASLPQLTKGK